MKKEKNDFPLRTAAKEIKISFVLTAVVDLILGVILLFAPEHVTDVLVMLISAGITIYGVFNILSFIFSRGMTAYSFELLIGICATAFGVFSFISPSFLPSVLKSYGFDRWYFMLISAIVTLVLAISIVAFPNLYGNMLIMAIGIVMILEAVSDLLGIHRLSKFIKDNVTITYGE